MPITLLPSWRIHEKAGLHSPTALGRRTIPEPWRPHPEVVRPESFPTPFGIAESVRVVLERGLFESKFAKRFGFLVEGAALGLFDCETYDLAMDADNLGKALCTLHPEAQGFRFLTMLRDRASGLVFGATAPHCLFWPHARRTEAEWDDLKDRVANDRNRERALDLLADFRASLGQAWNPTTVAWMKGMDRLIGDRRSDPGLAVLRNDSMSLAAVPLWVAPGRPALLYFPVLAQGFGRALLGWMRGTFTRTEGAVEIQDGRGAVVARIRIPKERERCNCLFLGAGLVAGGEAAGEFGSAAKPRIDDDGKGPGIVTMLQPVLKALSELGGVDRMRVQAEPSRFPDVVRRVLAAFGDVHVAGGARPSFSRRLEDLALTPGFPGYPDESAFAAGGDQNVGEAVTLPNGRQLFFVERLAGVDVGDLRSLGYGLFRHFIADGEYANGKLHGGEGDVLAESRDDRPLDSTAAAHAAVRDGRLREHFRRRLATVQRFHRSYAENRGGEDAAGARVAAAAARAFACWVCGAEPLPIGTRATRWSGGKFGPLTVPLAVDAHL